MKSASGEIVASQIASIPNSNKGYGYITIETQDRKHVKIKVDAMTKYETVERGEKVTVEYDVLGNTDILSAKKILRKS
jgi:cold shock CspA family protein